MSSFVSFLKENKEKIAYSYPYLGIFAFLCFIGWISNSLYCSYLSITVFIIVTPLLNKDIRLLLLPALFSFTSYRGELEFSVIPIPIFIAGISLFLSLFIYTYRNVRSPSFKPRINILTKSLILIGSVLLLSTVIRHIFFNSYALKDYVTVRPGLYDPTITLDIPWYSFTRFYKISSGYITSLIFILLAFFSILISSCEKSDKNILEITMYIFSIFLITQYFCSFFLHTFYLGWGGKNVFAIALEINIPVLIYLYSKNYKRIDYLIVCIFLLAIVFIIQSRGAMITLLITSPLFIFIFLKNDKTKIKYIIISYSITITLGVLCALIIPPLKSYALNLIKTGFNIKGRDEYWGWIFDYLKTSPIHIIFGGSPTFLFELYPGFYYLVMNKTDYTPYRILLCHNTFMTMLAMGGIIGIIALLFHRYDTIKGIIKDKTNISYNYMVIYFISIGLIHGLIDNTLFNVMYTIPYIFLLSSYKLDYTKKNDSNNTKSIKIIESE